ncbi:MAG TPA: phenylalanine--tRNA ligase beta subunit-related protein [Aggregatilineales bacterium]|nr:phenylalanine--tRNA ligase beta subunit-related protein [Aggregatilineales bacterium]
MALTFTYHPEILAKYPNLCAGVILARGMQNGPSPDSLKDEFMAEQRAVTTRLSQTQLSDLPSIKAWRSAFRSFGVEPTQYRCAAESLMRRLNLNKGDIPSINALVDIGNIVSIRYALPTAVFDAARLTGPVTVHFADGSENYVGLGQTVVEHPEVGEVVFTDPSKKVIARRWCWRQSDDGAARESTTDAIICVEAQHPGARPEIEAALADLLRLFQEYAGGTYVSGVLGVDQPSITMP